MYAFVKSISGNIYKVYHHGQDWQVLGPQYERWASVWTNDVSGSFNRAIDNIPEPIIETVIC